MATFHATQEMRSDLVLPPINLLERLVGMKPAKYPFRTGVFMPAHVIYSSKIRSSKISNSNKIKGVI